MGAAGPAPPPAAPAAPAVADEPAPLIAAAPVPAVLVVLGVVCVAFDPPLPALFAEPELGVLLAVVPALGAEPLPLVAALDVDAELPEAWALSMPVVLEFSAPPPHATSMGNSESEPKMTDFMVGPHAENCRLNSVRAAALGP
ncbi:MAG TPA: hypothetical protein VFN67_24425 [Polyangiales bacterium]|nr:hypothetical protein [Polyangiales bacterium]